MATRRLTNADRVLVALARAAGDTTDKVPYEEIVIESWRLFPERFALRNHPEHPDSSDQHKRLYQTLMPKGLVRQLGNKVFRLTDEGLRAAKNITEPATQGRMDDKGRLSRSDRELIGRALASKAFTKWRSGQKELIVDFEARLFFQFGVVAAPKARQAQVDSMRQAISRAVDGDVDTGELESLADYLREKFGESLGISA